MTPALEIFFNTCSTILKKEAGDPKTLEQFKSYLETDPVMKSGVEAIVQAMKTYTKSVLDEVSPGTEIDLL